MTGLRAFNWLDQYASSTPSAFEVILQQRAIQITYLLTYLLAYLLMPLPAVLAAWPTVTQNAPFSSRCQYLSRLSTKGWPGWVGLGSIPANGQPSLYWPSWTWSNFFDVYSQWRIQGGQSGHAPPIRPCPHPIVEQLFNYKNTRTQNTIRKKCIHCGQLILKKSSKISATRWQIFRLKCTKFDLAAGELTALPQTPYIAVFKGTYF